MLSVIVEIPLTSQKLAKGYCDQCHCGGIRKRGMTLCTKAWTLGNKAWRYEVVGFDSLSLRMLRESIY